MAIVDKLPEVRKVPVLGCGLIWSNQSRRKKREKMLADLEGKQDLKQFLLRLYWGSDT